MKNFENIAKEHKDITTFKIMENVLGDSAESGGDAHLLKSEQERQYQKIKELFWKSKRFLFDGKIAQNIYSKEYAEYVVLETKPVHISREKQFEIPFPESSFFFDKPIEINWSDREYSSHNQKFVPQEFLGFIITEMPKNYWGNEFAKGKEKSKCCRAYLAFLDDQTEKYDMVVSHQFVDFFVQKTEDEQMLWVAHISHLCSGKEYCEIKESGVPKSLEPFVVKTCQQYINSVAVIELLIQLANTLNQKENVYKSSGKTIWDYIPMSFRNLQKVSKIPDPYYVTKVNDKRYFYDVINKGSGTKHRFRYDVRKHPRIVYDRIVWIGSHQRGHGEYIPKTYSKMRILSAGFLFTKAEGLTKYRIFERALIFLIKIYRKFKKAK